MAAYCFRMRATIFLWQRVARALAPSALTECSRWGRFAHVIDPVVVRRAWSGARDVRRGCDERDRYTRDPGALVCGPVSNYMCADTQAAANARLVDYQARIGIAELWGGGLGRLRRRAALPGAGADRPGRLQPSILGVQARHRLADRGQRPVRPASRRSSSPPPFATASTSWTNHHVVFASTADSDGAGLCGDATNWAVT